MESTAAVSVSRCRGRSQFFTQGRGLTEQLPNKKITGRYFWHSRTHKGQHRRFTVFPGSRSSFTQKRPTDRENKKPTWHALGWRFVGTKNESSVSSDWKETIQPIWRRSLLLFQRWPTTTSLWLRIDFQEFFFSSCPVWHKRNGNYSKAISLWWLICIRLLSECPTVEMGGINTILRTEIRRRKKRILHHLTATTTAITIQRITIKLFFRFLFK